jgi:hypothetical protein
MDIYRRAAYPAGLNELHFNLGRLVPTLAARCPDKAQAASCKDQPATERRVYEVLQRNVLGK